jgi:hypothetical protein
VQRNMMQRCTRRYGSQEHAFLQGGPTAKAVVPQTRWCRQQQGLSRCWL